MTLENVISVCSKPDIQTWGVASVRILKYINSKNYTIITPESDTKEFIKCTPREYTVVSEEDYLTPVFKKLLNQKIQSSSIGSSRHGWYLQQFLKLIALENTSDDGLALIWDADTVPLKKLTFQKDGKVLFYKGDEFHPPYFKVIKSLLKLEKTNSFSFIAQCLPCKGSWLKTMRKTIEINSQKNWLEGILDSIDFNNSSGFSEYETIGTFIESCYFEKISILNNRWSRYGGGLIGSINNLWLLEDILKSRYDFIAFEKWNEPYSRYPGRKLRRYLKALKVKNHDL